MGDYNIYIGLRLSELKTSKKFSIHNPLTLFVSCWVDFDFLIGEKDKTSICTHILPLSISNILFHLDIDMFPQVHDVH